MSKLVILVVTNYLNWQMHNLFKTNFHDVGWPYKCINLLVIYGSKICYQNQTKRSKEAKLHRLSCTQSVGLQAKQS